MRSIPMAVMIVFLHLTTVSCSEPGEEAVNPPGYDLTKPTVYKMPSVLEEISGIAFSKGDAGTVYAEQDEEGKLFYFHLGDAEVKHTKFSKRGDYEDVAISNGQVIMLRSDGDFFTFPLSAASNPEVENAMEQPGLLPPGEYESLYADETNNTLYVLCKSCADDKSEQTISGHIFSVGPDGKLTLKDHFALDETGIAAPEAVEKKNGKGKKKFKAGRTKPSGMARNPVTNQWYILSSVSRTLIIADAQWKVISTHPLNPSLFTQPEGIAFDNAGNLYIANEKGNGELGTILLFKYQKK